MIFYETKLKNNGLPKKESTHRDFLAELGYSRWRVRFQAGGTTARL